jgi:Fe-S-cluster-containing hydrogenase component 2
MDNTKRKREANKISRRDFLKNSGLAVSGVIVGAAGASFLLPEKIADIPKAKGHIEQLSFEESACTGCGTCELVCAVVHEGSVGPSLRRIWLDRDSIGLIHNILACQQCDYPGCYLVCPRKDEALYIDNETRARCINPSKCIANCSKCIEACLFNPPRINLNKENNAHLICDLCKDRSKGPACVEFCPVECLRLKE